MLHEWRKDGGSKEELEAGLKMIGRNDILVTLVGGNNNNVNIKDINGKDDDAGIVENNAKENDEFGLASNEERNMDGSSVDELQVIS